MTMIPPFTGRCLCGRVRYSCDAAPLWQGFCHCESCRRATSSPVTAFFGIANGHWRWTGETPASFASSPGVWRDFCPHCGAQVSYRADRFPDETHFYAASLDDPSRYTPEKHFFTAEQLGWLHLADGLPQRP